MIPFPNMTTDTAIPTTRRIRVSFESLKPGDRFISPRTGSEFVRTTEEPGSDRSIVCLAKAGHRGRCSPGEVTDWTGIYRDGQTEPAGDVEIEVRHLIPAEVEPGQKFRVLYVSGGALVRGAEYLRVSFAQCNELDGSTKFWALRLDSHELAGLPRDTMVEVIQ